MTTLGDGMTQKEDIPLYGIISASGGQWTVDYQVHPRKDGSGIVSHGVTGYGDFPRDRFPDLPVIDYRRATSNQILKALALPSSVRAREENPIAYSGTLIGFLNEIRKIGIRIDDHKTTCDACNQEIPSSIAQMDRDNREVLCPDCYKRGC